MKSGNKTVLLRPEETRSGPPEEWILQFAGNLKVLFSRINDGVPDIIVCSPGDRDARHLVQTADLVLAVIHSSWLQDDAYEKFIESEIAGGKDLAGKVVLIKTSAGIRASGKSKLNQFPVCSFTESKDLGKDTGWISETDPAYWSNMLDLIRDITRKRTSDSGIIYLAQAESGTATSYDTIRRELIGAR